MACFGSCGCEACCMSASELAEIASGVEIEIYAEDYPAYSPPIDSSSASMTSDGCCHVATWERNPPFSYTCRKTRALTVDTSVTVSTKITKTKTHVMSPSSTALASNIEGDCVLQNPPWEYFPPEGAASLCDDVYNCGTAALVVQRKEQLWGGLGYRRPIFKVAIHKLNLTCTEGQSAECKYVVEVAQGIDVSTYGNTYTSTSRTSTTSNIHPCCTEVIECDRSNPHGPEPNCNEMEGNENGWAGGLIVNRYWIVKYKVFDTLEDMPSEMIFDADDGWPCDKFTFCTYDGPLVSGDDLCFEFTGSLDPYEAGEVYTIAFMYNCGFCLDTGVECLGNSVLETTNEPFLCVSDRGIGNAACDNSGFPNRYVGRNYGYGALTGDGVSTVFYGLRDAPFIVVTGGCFEYLYDNSNCKPDPPDRNECNWYDCADCYGSNSDGPLLPYQFKLHTVDAYSFNQTFGGFDVDSSPICIPFLRTKVTLIP